MSFKDSLSKIEINCPPVPSQEFYVKIDGKALKGVRGFKVEQHCLKRPMATVTIEFYANLKSLKVDGAVRKIKEDK